MNKYDSTILPQNNEPQEIQKGNLDLLSKINAVIDYAKSIFTKQSDYETVTNTELARLEADKVGIASTTFIENTSGVKTYTKKMTGTTASTQGGSTSIAHGLDSTKIIFFCGIVFYSASGIVAEAYTANAGFQFNVDISALNLSVSNQAANSANILSKPFIVTVIYEA